MKQTDDELVRLYLRGKIKAFEVLYERYGMGMFRFVLSLGGSREQAEDVVQTTWLKAIDNLESYRCPDRFKPWLFQTAYRTWLNDVRSAWERRRVAVGSSNEDFEGLPVDKTLMNAETSRDMVTAREERTALYEALETLPDKMRQTVFLRIDAGLTFREIAETMGCPLGTALWRMKEAVRRLKTMIGHG